jgi:DNA topoisomerase-1
VFDGWTRVATSRDSEKAYRLPLLKTGDKLILKEVLPYQHFTKPIARFSEASLVSELEKRGIGRPSTYSSIISTILDRGYARIENRRFYSEKIGEVVTDRLVESFSELMNYDFTAHMENFLDKIANKEIGWKELLEDFFYRFCQQLDIAERKPEDGGMSPNYVVPISFSCPSCGSDMGIRTARTGVFLGCSSYIVSDKRCRQTINLTLESKDYHNKEEEIHELSSRCRCQDCGTAMDNYIIDGKHTLYICGNNPSCYGYKIEMGSASSDHCNPEIIECNKCNSDMSLKAGRFGKYMACINAKCNNTRKILQSGEVAPPREDPTPFPELSCSKSNDHFVLRDGAAGVFLAASSFPKSRETRAPLVEELQRFRERLPKKLKYLADAPVTDPEGNKTIVRFSRKTKEQYISSEKKNRSSWYVVYIKGSWIAK